MTAISVQDAAERMALSPHAIYRLVKTGRLPASRPTGPNGPLRILETDLDELMATTRVSPPRPLRVAPVAVRPGPASAGSVAALNAIEWEGRAA